MTRELILHIGAHKTGTKTIQAALAASTDALAAQGIDYIWLGREPNLHAVLGLETPGEMVPGGFTLRKPEALADLLAATTAPRIVASSENFSFFFRRENIAALAEMLLTHVDRVRILTWLRRQDSHIVSHHQEGAKPFRGPEEALFGTEARAIAWNAPHRDLYLDYAHRIGHWLDVFGNENVTVRIYDRAKMIGGDAWLDFLDAAGIDSAGIETAEARNQSFGLTQAKLGHLMAQRAIPQPARQQVMNRLTGAGPRLMPSRDEARRFYDPYRNSNAALAKRLGWKAGTALFDEDFSEFPEVATESWAEETANEAILVLLDLINDLSTRPGPQRLLEAAMVAREAQRPKLALELVEAALALRPNAPNFREAHTQMVQDVASNKDAKRLRGLFRR